MSAVQAGVPRRPAVELYGELLPLLAPVLVVAMLVLPIPPALLDLVLAFNLAVAMAVLFLTMFVERPLAFSSFPSFLLLLTLLRLGLNVAAARLILLQADAGQLIDAFGSLVMQGNYVVGFVIFLILMIIQFAVVTNGAGRVAEVAARFTLDAMPGKQMAIDADLNAGLLSEEAARERRTQIQLEADFYGAMDGASKFIKGDAIAAVIIVLANLLGGFAVGMLTHGMTFQEALQTYALLTVGAGLVTQVPSLLISTASGIIVTRSSAQASMGRELTTQLLSVPRALVSVGALMAAATLVPNMPRLPFLVLGAAFVLGGLALRRPAVEQPVERAKPSEEPTEDVGSLLRVDPVEVEIGYSLIPLVEGGQGGSLLEKVAGVRRQIALELGFVLPKVRVRDNLRLPPAAYAIRLRGEEIARGEVRPGQYLAIPSAGQPPDVGGVPTTEPVFGLPALWIEEADRDRAEALGCTVVDSGTVIMTHLTEVVKGHAASLLSRQEVRRLLDGLRPDHPALVEEVVPDILETGEVQRILQSLLRERVPIRDLVTILESAAARARETKDPEVLTEHVRQALGRTIVNVYRDEKGTLHVLTLAPRLERVLLQALQEAPDGVVLHLEPGRAETLLARLGSGVEAMAGAGHQPVLLLSPRLRRAVHRLVVRSLPYLAVLSYAEVPAGVEVYAEGAIDLEGDDA